MARPAAGGWAWRFVDSSRSAAALVPAPANSSRRVIFIDIVARLVTNDSPGAVERAAEIVEGLRAPSGIERFTDTIKCGHDASC
jgi:hypothetical protein